MRRRDVIVMLGGMTAAWVGPALGQRIARIGYLSVQQRPDSFADHIFLKGMQALGHVEGKSFEVDWRFTGGRYDLLPEAALDLVRSNPAVIVATTQLAVRAAQKASTTIPIVMAVSNDPVQMGLVESIARPGGNTTGASSADEERLQKQLDLSIMIVPSLSRVALMSGAGVSSARTSGSFDAVRELEMSARGKAVTIDHVVARNPHEIENAFLKMRDVNDQALILRSNPTLNEHRSLIARLALAARLSSIATRAEFVEAGGLISYGESLADLYGRVAYFVDKILRGAKPSELPIELPSRFTLAANQQTARALGLVIPHEVLAVADRIID